MTTSNADKLISIQEYAEIKGISRQAVYKQLTTKLSKWVVIVDSKKYLRAAVLDNDCKPSVNQAVNENVNQVDSKVDTDIVAVLTEQLRVKDEQITSLHKQIEQQHGEIDKLTELLHTAQLIQAKQSQVLLAEPKQDKPSFKQRLHEFFFNDTDTEQTRSTKGGL